MTPLLLEHVSVCRFLLRYLRLALHIMATVMRGSRRAALDARKLGTVLMVSRRSFHGRRAPKPASPEVSKLLDNYAHRPAQALKLSNLLSYAKPVTPQSVLASVAHVQRDMPRRLAMRITALEALPYIVGTNPYIARQLQHYRESFMWVASHPPVETLEENKVFAERLAGIVESHANDIPTLARGCVGCVHEMMVSMLKHNLVSFQECTRYMNPAAISDFLDAAIRIRIDVRLLAEEHIAITRVLEEPERQEARVGIIHTKCSPAYMIKMVGSFVSDLCEATLGMAPQIIIDGHPDATFQ